MISQPLVFPAQRPMKTLSRIAAMLLLCAPLASYAAPATAEVRSEANRLATETGPAYSTNEPDSHVGWIGVKRHAAPADDSASQSFLAAVRLISEERLDEARTALKRTLELDASHEAARQTLAGLLIDAQQSEAAEALLRMGLELNPAQSNFAILLGYLLTARGDNAGALQVLRQHEASASSRLDYQAFIAALLQREGHHAEAIEAYAGLLERSPASGIWWMGLGRSLEATGQTEEAAAAYRQALATGTLSTGISQHLAVRLKELP